MAFAHSAVSVSTAGSRRVPLADRLPPLGKSPGAHDNLVLDCSAADRFGLRGAGVTNWLGEAGIVVPDSVNEAATLGSGAAILRLGQQEILLTASLAAHEQGLVDIRSAWADSALSPKGYDAYREEGWAWFVITGPNAPELMRRISMTDLRPSAFAAGRVAQTRALQLDAVIARLDRFGTTSYDLFVDVASSDFALDVLTQTTSDLASGFALAALR